MFKMQSHGMIVPAQADLASPYANLLVSQVTKIEKIISGAGDATARHRKAKLTPPDRAFKIEQVRPSALSEVEEVVAGTRRRLAEDQDVVTRVRGGHSVL
jgi:hypothetical protein